MICVDDGLFWHQHQEFYAGVQRVECIVIIGAVKESRRGETRVAVTPASVKQLLALGYEVVVDPGAGALSSFTDRAYAEAGATVGDALKADVVLAVNAPTSDQLDGLRAGATVVGILNPVLNPALVRARGGRPITALARDGGPGISRAQFLDGWSSWGIFEGIRGEGGG